MKKAFQLLSILSLSAASSHAAVSFTGTTINQTFTGYDGSAGPVGWDASGFSSDPGFSENRGSSTGGVTTGGTYAFDIGAGNIALGVQPGGSDFTPGFYQLEVVNDTGATLTSVDVSFEGYFFNDQGRGNSLGLSTSTDGTTFAPVVGSDFTSPADSDALGWTQGVDFSTTIPTSVPAGGSFFLRFDGDDSVGGGSRDEFAIDNVTFSSPVPEPSTALLGSLALLGLLRRRR